MQKIKHNIYTRYSGGEKADAAYKKLIGQAISAALKSEAVDAPCAVNVLITNDDGIRKYNRDYRGIDKATDVLSFPMQTFQQAGWNRHSDLEFDRDTGELPLGDIIISEESVSRQANEYGNTTGQETAYLIIHSTLHLLGYDHDKKSSEKLMRQKSKSIMEIMGYNMDRGYKQQ